MPKSPPISEQLKDAIRRSGESLYAIGKATGVDNGRLYRFMCGQRGLTLETVDRLCSYLGLVLREAKRKGGSER